MKTNSSFVLKLVLEIMKAFHEDRKEIQDLEILQSIADSIALPSSMTKSFLENTDLATDDVKDEAAENSGPAGAPFFILGRNGQPRRKFVFSGTQTPETLIAALNSLASNDLPAKRS